MSTLTSDVNAILTFRRNQKAKVLFDWLEILCWMGVVVGMARLQFVCKRFQRIPSYAATILAAEWPWYALG